ncbi:protein FLUORESCENT IN BLUE LIGHT, chloroplastic-like isoform X2 [Cynara cardunculus var. scolymus]|uniref:protein FLUORESCENT IN BLUE LIGHT, chloroplastic-like isoform X2 n=1 Tax=Cynara cardunculus var. scolymus TaxID=59895 RepID=UPI000D62A040|nr:protein FLUORESCENT IN BLUE LIGHT, chloroplastic-like isoform X2 [Cynara cardunculus var. scolymus]
MAVVAGCSTCVPFRPTSITSVSLVMNVQNFAFLRDECSRTLRTHRDLLGINAVHKKVDHCEGSRAAEIGQGFYETINEPFVSHQTDRLVGSLPAGVLVANALLLTAPLEALAETCEGQQSIFNMNMPLLLLVALIGATVGGLLARQRKAELQRLNEQLRQINAALKRQAKIESYAPALSYAPAAARVPENEVIVDPRKQELTSHLKNGKNFLRNHNPDKAFLEFKTALELAQNIKDPIEEKKAARGLGASLQRQGKHREAIKYHMMVLSVSEREGEDSGNTEAFGAIADCYTEIGDLERAATFYDQYIARLQAD